MTKQVMTKKNVVIGLASAVVLFGGSTFVFGSKPATQAPTVVQETTTTLSAEAKAQQAIVETAKEKVASAENNPDKEHVDVAKQAIEQVKAEDVKSELNKRVAVVEEQIVVREALAKENARVEAEEKAKAQATETAQASQSAQAPAVTTPANQATQPARQNTTAQASTRTPQPTVATSTNKPLSQKSREEITSQEELQAWVDLKEKEISQKSSKEEMERLGLRRTPKP